MPSPISISPLSGGHPDGDGVPDPRDPEPRLAEEGEAVAGASRRRRVQGEGRRPRQPKQAAPKRVLRQGRRGDCDAEAVLERGGEGTEGASLPQEVQPPEAQLEEEPEGEEAADRSKEGKARQEGGEEGEEREEEQKSETGQ